MYIKKLTMENFKKNTDKELDFSDINKIEGGNGSGKSTIRDAIVFCLYGTDAFGEKSNKFIKNGQKQCTVTTTFLGENGFSFKIKRVKGKQNKIYFIDGSQEFDNSDVPQRDLDSMIPNIKEFLSVFSVGYFMTLDDKEKRSFILSLTEDIDQEKIFYDLGGTEELLKKYENILFTDTTYKDILRIGKEKRRESDNKRSRMEFLSPVAVPEMQMKDVSARIVRMEHNIATHEERQRAYQTYQNDLARVQDKLDNNKRIKKEIAALKILKDVEMPTQDRLTNLLNKKNALSKIIRLPKNSCPTCLQKIDPAHENLVRAANDRVRTKAANLDRSIERERDLYERKLLVYQENEKQKIKKQTLETQFVEVETPVLLTEMPHLELLEASRTRLIELREKHIMYRTEMAEVERLQKMNYEMNIERDQLQNDVNLLADELQELRKLREIFAPSGIQATEMRMKLAPIIEKLKEFIEGITIKTLEEMVTTDGVKEVFQVRLNGKSYNKLSTGEKLRVDMALSMAINSLLQNKIDMYFIDNIESLDYEPTFTEGQIFTARVTDKNFKVNGISHK